MTTVTKSFTAVGVSAVLTVPAGRSITYSAAESTFVGIAYFERSRNSGASWETIETSTDASMTGGTLKNETTGDEWYRFRAVQNGEDAVSGTLACSVADVSDTVYELKARDGTTLLKVTDDEVTAVKRMRKLSVNAAGKAKAGATAGWVVAAGDNVGLVTCPASQTASTLVLPLHSLKVGDTITGFYLVGQIEGTSGNTTTVDAALRKHTAAAADVSDASVGAITQLSVTADTIMSSANTRKASLAEVVGEDETFYILITATTGASMDIALQGAVIEITEA